MPRSSDEKIISDSSRLISVTEFEPFAPGAPFHFASRLSAGARDALRLVTQGQILRWDSTTDKWVPK